MKNEKRRHAMMKVGGKCNAVVMTLRPGWSEAVVPWDGCGQGRVQRKRNQPGERMRAHRR